MSQKVDQRSDQDLSRICDVSIQNSTTWTTVYLSCLHLHPGTLYKPTGEKDKVHGIPDILVVSHSYLFPPFTRCHTELKTIKRCTSQLFLISMTKVLTDIILSHMDTKASSFLCLMYPISLLFGQWQKERVTMTCILSR